MTNSTETKVSTLPFWLSVRGPDVVISRTGIALDKAQAQTMLKAYDATLAVPSAPDAKLFGDPALTREQVSRQRRHLTDAMRLQGWTQ